MKIQWCTTWTPACNKKYNMRPSPKARFRIAALSKDCLKTFLKPGYLAEWKTNTSLSLTMISRNITLLVATNLIAEHKSMIVGELFCFL